MPLAKNIMGGGTSAGQARAILGNVNPAVSAAGTTQGTATLVDEDINIVTVATSGQGVILYAGQSADSQEFYNASGTDIKIYPPTGAKINQLATNAGFTVAPASYARCTCASSTQWLAFVI